MYSAVTCTASDGQLSSTGSGSSISLTTPNLQDVTITTPEPPKSPTVSRASSSQEIHTIANTLSLPLDDALGQSNEGSPPLSSRPRPTGGPPCRRRSVARFLPTDSSPEQPFALRDKRRDEFFHEARLQLIHKFIAAEKDYFGTLESLIALIQLLKEKQLPSREEIFRPVRPLFLVAQGVNAQLQDIVAQPSKFIDALKIFPQYGAVYHQFLLHRPMSQYLLNANTITMASDHPALSVLAGSQLDKKMAAPIVRLDDYQHFLDRLIDLTLDAKERAELVEIAIGFQQAAGSIQQRKNRAVNQQLCLKFQRLLAGRGGQPPPPVVSSAVAFVGMHKFPMIVARKKEYRPAIMWLFSDKLVLTKDEASGKYKLIEMIDLTDPLAVASEIPPTMQSNEMAPVWCFSILGARPDSQKSFVMCQDSEIQRLWMETLCKKEDFDGSQAPPMGRDSHLVMCSPRKKTIQNIQKQQSMLGRIGMVSPRASDQLEHRSPSPPAASASHEDEGQHHHQQQQPRSQVTSPLESTDSVDSFDAAVATSSSGNLAAIGISDPATRRHRKKSHRDREHRVHRGKKSKTEKSFPDLRNVASVDDDISPRARSRSLTDQDAEAPAPAVSREPSVVTNE